MMFGILLPRYVNEVGKFLNFSNEKISINEYDSETAIETMLYQKEFDTSAWGKLYKTTFFDEIKFPVGKLYEDIGTIYKVLFKAKKIVYMNKPKYYYLQRSTSIMGRNFKLKDLDYIYEAEKLIMDERIINNEKLYKAAKCRFINANFSILLKIRKEKEKYSKEKEFILSNIKKYRKEVLLNSKSRLKTKIAILLNYIKII